MVLSYRQKRWNISSISLAGVGSVKTNNLASRFGVDPSTITKTISELADSGYITHTPYHGVCLSEKGIRYAEFCIKRHRILALMLTHYGTLAGTGMQRSLAV